MVTGQGGWPLTIIMTPDKRPFFAATYLPKERRFSLYGLLELLPRIVKAWHDQRTELLQSSEKIVRALQVRPPGSPGGIRMLPFSTTGTRSWSCGSIPGTGGSGRPRSSRHPISCSFFSGYWKRTGTSRALDMAVKTLDAMRDGGIRDQLGGGFHRYSTDARWRVPHFEKMLYDQALLLMAYTEAFQATGHVRFREDAEEIISYLLRNLRSPEGGFFSAEDADSPGGEGAFYRWTMADLVSVLGKEDGTLAARIFNVQSSGNPAAPRDDDSGGTLYRTRPAGELAASLGMTEPGFMDRFASLRDRLAAAREKRPRPSRDDKVLSDWNGLTIAALAKAGRVFGNLQARAAAEQAIAFILAQMRTGTGRLLHRYRDGEAAIPAFADDYAFVTLGLIELYETTFEVRYLSEALALNDLFVAHFLDAEQGGFFSVADDAEPALCPEEGDL